MIEGQKDFGSPTGWIMGTDSIELIESNTLDRYWIANIEAKANAELAHARSTLGDAGQKPRQLSSVQNKIIRPFDSDRKAMALQSFCKRHSNR
jgi:hypothetical protein